MAENVDAQLSSELEQNAQGGPSEGKGQKRKRQLEKFAHRMAFSKFVDTTRVYKIASPDWRCCGNVFPTHPEIHKHVAKNHSDDIAKLKEKYVEEGVPDAKWKLLRKYPVMPESGYEGEEKLPSKFTPEDSNDWLPRSNESETTGDSSTIVLLFYKYCDVKDVQHVLRWQEELCNRFKLTGKIRIGSEGINATLAGQQLNTEIYRKAVMSHPYFCDIKWEDFKTSPGNSGVFPDGLKIGVHKEIVPMGIDPSEVSYRQTGTHLTPEQFHKAMEKIQTGTDGDASVVVDCRNFYESKIGKFEGAVAPDLRKFSYWPEYVDANIDFLKKKKIYMYCTGGIRCERGSSYLKSKGVDEVYQLEGGIHKYIEQYPDGYYRGKLFVFDNRYTIQSNDDVISTCRYCRTAWDKYEPCSSTHCHQLVLSCYKCRNMDLSSCCPKCKENNASAVVKEECDCTQGRVRIPVEESARILILVGTKCQPVIDIHALFKNVRYTLISS